MELGVAAVLGLAEEGEVSALLLVGDGRTLERTSEVMGRCHRLLLGSGASSRNA